MSLVVLLFVLAACGGAAQPQVDNAALEEANAKAAEAEAKLAELEAAAKAAEEEAASAQANAETSAQQIAEAQAEAEAAMKEVEAAKAEAEAAMREADAAKAEAEAARSEAAAPSGDSLLPVDVPRDELFVMDQIYRFSTGIGNYNLWGTGDTPHRHALMMETLWYRDQETGDLIYGVAIEDPQYNDDFTQMTVKLRGASFWSR
jgi:peptide/nickel transport system substrate-binding protein